MQKFHCLLLVLDMIWMTVPLMRYGISKVMEEHIVKGFIANQEFCILNSQMVQNLFK